MMRTWVRQMRGRKKAEQKNADLENVRRVFEPISHVDEVKEKEPLHKRLLYMSVNETSLPFYLWTTVVFVGCFYNLVTIVIIVFEEVRRNFYDSWIRYNIVFDLIFFCDLLVLTRRHATIDDWIFSYDKIPDPILIQCGVDDAYNMTGERCQMDLIPPLRFYEEHDNMTEEVDLAMMYWGNRSQAIPFTKFVKQYALSFYWSALTLVTLGEQPSPNNTFQNMFEICDTLLGLVLFAVIVGDVGNMVTTMNMKRSDFEEVLDGCKSYMIYRKVHRLLQRKAVEYFSYTWAHGGGQVDEEEIEEYLPPRLYGQLAVHIHMETLRRVKLFEDCEPNLLYELILKLELRVYSPMDYVCKKGDVGTEMYIVKEGAVEVVNEDGTKVFVRLGEGTVFGELSILNIPGNKNGNRRTANVRSVGYSDLYVLSKDDLWAALREYPEAKYSLMEKGRNILAKDNLLEETADEEELDQDAPVEEQLAYAAKVIKELEAQLDEAERKFWSSSAKAKKNLYKLEQEMDQELKWMENEGYRAGRPRAASLR
ncbi:unnamed protein product [Cylicocyclus nassatus]|uniref:Cyclic nucleotide-binding domain-containing protein n=1 Tax=Cylicocyclus nassatus TaxID=53992 RepID=A0AA36MG39_CYLNA|nr:unnamed protein product [Cylicocyclus nassatus]